MGITINNLTVAITIGGNELILESDTLGTDSGNLTDTMENRLAQGFSFKMQQGSVVSVSVGQLISWFQTNFAGKVDTLENEINGFVQDSTNTTDPALVDGIILELRDLYFNATKNPSLELDFGFNIKLVLDETFYNELGLDAITDIISVNSVGFSLAYSN